MTNRERSRRTEVLIEKNNKPNLKPDAAMLALTILAGLPREDSLTSIYRLSIRSGAIHENFLKTYIDAEPSENEGVRIQLDALINKLQEALNLIGFWGNLSIKFKGRKLLDFEYHRTTGLNEGYCVYCIYHKHNCRECTPKLSEDWLDIDVKL